MENDWEAKFHGKPMWVKDAMYLIIDAVILKQIYKYKFSYLLKDLGFSHIVTF